MPKEVEKKCMQELKKLKNMSPMSAEATVVRNYLDWMIDLPWHKKSDVAIDLKKNTEPETVKRQLYKYTSLESSLSFNTLAIVDKKPKNCNLKDFLESFLKFREDVVTKKIKFDLKKRVLLLCEPMQLITQHILFLLRNSIDKSLLILNFVSKNNLLFSTK